MILVGFLEVALFKLGMHDNPSHQSNLKIFTNKMVITKELFKS